MWIAAIIIAIAIGFGALITIKLNSIAHDPQSTVPSGQTLFRDALK
jgi:hypothetical protein